MGGQSGHICRCDRGGNRVGAVAQVAAAAVAEKKLVRNTLAYLFLGCVAAAIAGLVLMAMPDAPPKPRPESDEIARLKQEIKHRDAIIARQAEIIAQLQAR